jgi:hypothetical protein
VSTSTRSWPKHASSRPSWRKNTAPCGCFAPPSRGKPPRVANVRVSWADKPAIVSMPTSTSTTRIRPRERARSSSPPRHCCGPCPPLRHPRHGTCTARRKRSLSNRPPSRPKARRPASANRGVRGTTGARKALNPRYTLVERRNAPPTRAHAGQRPAPRHARESARRRCPQCHQRPTDEQSGGAGSSRLPPLAGWTLR